MEGGIVCHAGAPDTSAPRAATLRDSPMNARLLACYLGLLLAAIAAFVGVSELGATMLALNVFAPTTTDVGRGMNPQ